LDDAALLLEVPAEALQVRREVARGPLPPGGATVRGTGRGGAPAPSGPGRWAWVPPMWEYLHPLSVRTQIRRNGSCCKVKRFGMSDPRFAGSNWRLPRVACPTPGSLAGAAWRGGVAGAPPKRPPHGDRERGRGPGLLDGARALVVELRRRPQALGRGGTCHRRGGIPRSYTLLSDCLRVTHIAHCVRECARCCRQKILMDKRDSAGMISCLTITHMDQRICFGAKFIGCFSSSHDFSVN